MYMNLLGKPTDDDLNTYPHVLLTGRHEWDPSILDYTPQPKLVTPPFAPDPSQCDAHDPRIDEFGNLFWESSSHPHSSPWHLQPFLTQTCYQNSTH